MFDGVDAFSNHLAKVNTDYYLTLIISLVVYLSLTLLASVVHYADSSTNLMVYTLVFLTFLAYTTTLILVPTLQGFSSNIYWADIYDPYTEPVNPQTHFEPKDVDLFE